MSNVMNLLRRLHRDEEGMETMQAVIIFGVAAVVLALLYKMRTPLESWVNTGLGELGVTGVGT